MNEPSALLERLSEEAVWRLEETCCRFEEDWQAGRRPYLEDFLAEAGGAERMALLRELFRLDLYYRRRAGEDPSPEEYETRFPEATAVLQEAFAPAAGIDWLQSRQELATIADPERTGGPEDPDLLPLVPEEEYRGHQGAVPLKEGTGEATPGRYRVLRFHAAGGLGEVYVAEDTELHREVALKEIKRQHADGRDARSRFVLEGKVTGRLEHPGVVPVYGLGSYTDGRPYYAMRLIQGESLGAAIGRFHVQSPGRFDSLEFRQLLGRFLAVCQTVAYAHSRGVLHRDLKPANVMLGNYGETLIVDWGLAKVLGRTDDNAAGPDRAKLLRPSGGGREQTVGAVGTPAFMSPEQAAGKVDELGPATDVYSLGATLYALLTNHLPFEGPVAQVLPQVERGAWLPARQRNAAVPAALDAICRKAMALRPEGRYASALELAADLEHWLADEPVGAYREPVGARLRRWVRKHPRKMTAAAVLLLAAVVGLTAGTILLERSKREAQENFKMTKAAAHKFLVAVNEEKLLDEPGMQGLRQELLTEALNYYRDFLEKRPGDPLVRQEQAEANRQLGEIYGQVGRMPEAKSLVEQSVREFNDVRGRAPADPEVRRGLAWSYLALAELQVRSGEPEEGREQAGQAIQLLEQLRSERPEDTEVLRLLGRGHDARATAEVHLGLLEAAIDDNAEAVKLLEYALRRHDGQGSSRHGRHIRHGDAGAWAVSVGAEELENSILLSRAWINEGLLLKLAGRKAAAAQALHWATGIARGLQSNNPRLSRLHNGLVLALLNAGHAEIELGRPAEGELALREALEWSLKLLKDDPIVPEYAAAYVQAVGYLGEDLFLSGQTTAAALLLHEAMDAADAADQLQKGEGKDLALSTHRARFVCVLGRLEGERGKLDSGLRHCEQAREAQERALAQAPGNRSLRSDWLGSREAIARLRSLAGQTGADAWIREQRQILSERKELAGRDPVLPYFRREMGASAAVLAGLLLETGQAAEALGVVEEVLPAHERLVQADRLVSRLQSRENERPKDDRFLSVGRLSPYVYPLWGPEPEDYQLRRVWGELLAQKGAALARIGRGAAAGECVRQAIGIVEELTRGDGYFVCPPCSWSSRWSILAEQLSRQEPRYLYDLACHVALASTLPGNEGGSDATGRAMAALRACGAAGFDNIHKLRTDPRLAPLRGRADFQRLVHELETRPPQKERLPSPQTARGWGTLFRGTAPSRGQSVH
ncbi:MAG TPA: serine/threonine-protein kinase [Gemmataceae bacterium]